jgi:hypothetical protein
VSIWDKPNPDAMSGEPAQASAGRRVGFLENVERGFESASFYRAQFGAENALREEEYENVQRIRNTGEDAPHTIDPEAADRFGTYGWLSYIETHDPYTDYLKRNNAGAYNTGDRMRDDKLRDLQAKYPDAGIKTYDEIYRGLRERANLLRRRESRSASFAGNVGWFLGEMGGSVDPRTNPFNFATLPVGGFGKTGLTRILSQAGGQSAIEAIDQVTGVRENQRLLGGDPSVAESVMQIAATGVGAGALQGVGEGLGWLGRRWFRNVPGDPAPPPPPIPERTERASTLALPYIITPQGPPKQLTYQPRNARGDDIITPPPPKQLTYQPRPFDISAEADAALSKAVQEVAGTSRLGKQGAIADATHVRTALNDFAGPMPWEIPPPSYTRMGKESPRKLPDAMRETPGETVDQIARRLDPDTFRVYDKYAAQKNELRAVLETRRGLRADTRDAQAKPLFDEIDALKARAGNVSKRNQKKYAERIAALEKQAEGIRNGKIEPDTEEVSIRQRLQEVDVRMRDLAMPVSRAYARAQKKWQVYDAQAKQLDEMIADGKTELPPVVDFDKAEVAFAQPRTLGDRVPELSSPSAKPIPKGTDAVDEVKRINGETAKMQDAQLEQFQQVYKVYDATLDAKPIREGEVKPAPKAKAKGAEAEPPPDEITVQGYDTPLHLDDDHVMWTYEDGRTAELSVRELFQELNENREVLKAITACSVVKTSGSV